MRGLLATALLATALLMGTVPLHAQGTRGWATTTVRWLELPTPVRVAGGGVAPTPGILQGWTGTQDLALTAWGLGARGVSVTTLLRGRLDDGDLAWPRAGDAFDAILLYAQLERGVWRVRLGRQENMSGLGFTGFDGASVRLAFADAGRGVVLEGFGGRSLARGLSEPRDQALRGLEDFVPDDDAWLVGGALEARLGGGTSAAFRYQREIWADRSGLISERASVDLRTALLAPVRLTGAMDWDFAFARVGKAHLTASWAPTPTSLLELSGRRYLPYFELSTVWGFFDPVGWHEARLRGSLSVTPGLGWWASAGIRAYEDAQGPVFLSPLEDRGWRGETGLSWQPGPAVRVGGRYEIDWLPGAFLQGGSADLAWTVLPDLTVTASGTTFQRFEEFRLGDGRALGAGLGLSAGLTDRTRLDAGVARYRHTREGGGAGAVDPWSQSRAWMSVRVALGDDPGLRGQPRPGGGS